jgi:hypothetical protein
MKRTILVMAATLVACGLLVAGASAFRSFSTQVTIKGTQGQFSDFYVFGNVTARHHKCVANRRVNVSKVESSPSGPVNILVDTARTSDNGAWAAHGDFSGSAGVRATAVRRKFGRHHHKVCKSGSAGMLFTP